jgi:hypothetical protein
MPMISSNDMPHMGFLREGKPPIRYIAVGIGNCPRSPTAKNQFPRINMPNRNIGEISRRRDTSVLVENHVGPRVVRLLFQVERGKLGV